MSAKAKYPCIGAKLKVQVKARGYTVKRAAEIMGISDANLYDIMSQDQMLSARIASRLHRIGIDGKALFLEQAAHIFSQHAAQEQDFLAVVQRLARTG